MGGKVLREISLPKGCSSIQTPHRHQTQFLGSRSLCQRGVRRLASFPLRMKASALVLRVEQPSVGLQGGFATVNNSFEFRRGDAVVENDWKLWTN